MRGVAIFVALAALATGAASIVGNAAASHNASPIIQRSALAPTWSPDGKQLVFAYIGYSSTAYGLYPTQLRIVRTSSKPAGRLRTVLREKGKTLSARLHGRRAAGSWSTKMTR